MRGEKVCDNVCLGSCKWSFYLDFMAMKLPLREDFWQSHIPEVAAFNEIREALRRFLRSASVDFQWFSVQI